MAKKIFKNCKIGDKVFEVVGNSHIVSHTITSFKWGKCCLDDGTVIGFCHATSNRTKGKYFLNEKDAEDFITWVKTAKTFGALKVGDIIYCITEDNVIEEKLIDEIRIDEENGDYMFYADKKRLPIIDTRYGAFYDRIFKVDDTDSLLLYHIRIFLNKVDAEKDVEERNKRKLKAAITKKNKVKPCGTLLKKKDRFGHDLHVGDKVHYIYSYYAPYNSATMLYTINEGVVIDETSEKISVKSTAPNDICGMENKTIPDRIVVIKKWNEF